MLITEMRKALRLFLPMHFPLSVGDCEDVLSMADGRSLDRDLGIKRNPQHTPAVVQITKMQVIVYSVLQVVERECTGERQGLSDPVGIGTNKCSVPVSNGDYFLCSFWICS